MITSFLYILLALLGIGLLIFIHELGHYYMARKVGIKVEAFAIGLGKPILEWEWDGVKWKIGWLPFGGYVKMAGMEKVGGIEPYQVEGGFMASRPWNRIKVVAAGPLVNIVFTFVAFSLLWMTGGREKPFSESTRHIGWVDQESALYQTGVRPGDLIEQVNNRPFKGFNSLYTGAALDKNSLTLKGEEIDYFAGKQTPFVYTFHSEQEKDGMSRILMIQNAMSPASFLIYNSPKKSLPAGSPLAGSGLQEGDRILWVDGELIFSVKQLVSVINSPRVFLSVMRDGKLIQTRVPRLPIGDLRLTSQEKEELDDWRFEAKLGATPVGELQFIPYLLSASGVVEQPLGYVDETAHSKLLFQEEDRSISEKGLLPGDRIVAVQGIPITSGIEALFQLQKRKNLLIVKSSLKEEAKSAADVDAGFPGGFDIPKIKKIVASIGSSRVIDQAGPLSLLKPVEPLPLDKLPLSPQQRAAFQERFDKLKDSIAEMEDPKQKEAAEESLKKTQNQLMLGLALQDKMVRYNPPPQVLFVDVFKETYRTLYALVTGFLSPKYVSGPVGIVQVIHYGWSQGVKEALYWLGMISLNLGILNLLPIPVLDGGHIVFAVWEAITKKPLKAKTMERLIIPFVILLIALFVYFTFNDLARIFTQLFS